MKYTGVRGLFLEWFKSYLSDGAQFVYNNGVLSKEAFIKCEVPQGPILGPLLFLMYVSDISGITDYATSRMYGDDTGVTSTACGIPELRHSMIAARVQYLHRLSWS